MIEREGVCEGQRDCVTYVFGGRRECAREGEHVGEREYVRERECLKEMCERDMCVKEVCER